jgi:hypothetical protein
VAKELLKISMIKSKEDYEFYLMADRLALAIKHKRPKDIQIINRLFSFKPSR